MNYYDPNGVNPYYTGQMPLYPQYAQPQLQTWQQPIQRKDDNHFVWIQGREAAMAYPIVPNTTLIFLDDQQPYVYKKKTDTEGKTAEFKVFKLVEEFPNSAPIQQLPAQEYVTKEEFTSLQKSIEELKASLESKLYHSKSSYRKGGERNG